MRLLPEQPRSLLWHVNNCSLPMKSELWMWPTWGRERREFKSRHGTGCVYQGFGKVALSAEKGDSAAWHAGFCIEQAESFGSHSLVSENVFGGWARILSPVDARVSYSSPACSIWTSFGIPLFLPCKTLVTRNSVSPKLTCSAAVQLHQSRKLFPLIFSWHVPVYNLNSLAPV